MWPPLMMDVFNENNCPNLYQAPLAGLHSLHFLRVLKFKYPCRQCGESFQPG